MKVESSRDMYEACRLKLARKKFEHFIVILLNTKNEIIRQQIVAMGGTSECHVDPVAVFHFAIKHALPRMILVHNHPSGDTQPSPHDVALTRRLKEGAEILGLTVLDHIIVGAKGYCSLRDIGIIS